MPKAIVTVQPSLRPSNSKGASAPSSSATQRANTGRNSNLTSAQKRNYGASTVSPHPRRTDSRAPVARTRAASSREDFNSEDDDRPPAKTRKTSKTAKVTTAKEKRQATLAAAEENAARLTAGTESGADSGEDDWFGTNNGHADNTGHHEALDFAVDASDDGEEELEAIHRPRLYKSQNIEDSIDSDGAAGLDNVDSDEDDPANSPRRYVSKKGKSVGVKFADATATTISSKLPARKIPANQNITSQSSNVSSDGLTTPVKTATASSSSPLSNTASPPRTPLKSVANPRRPRMGDQTPSTFGLLKASASDTRLELFVKDAFPERTIFTETCKATFLAACADVQATLHHKRFLKSNSYRGLILTILRQKLSQVRQEVRNAALAKAAMHYGISSTMSSAEIVALVEGLKNKITFVFGNTDQYKRPYANPIFQIMINTLFFEGKRKSDAIANPAPWNPMPLPVIALMATAVYSVLDDWSTGKNEAAKNKFSHDKYAPVYRDHLANLFKFKEKAPAALSKLQVSLWENAWLSSGSALPDQANVSIDDDVFAEAEAEALS
ncbi:hypothetical protein M407DRAFT_26196 [Tulasnella calospora MUT 4182]|uniref:DUF6532 domain-containing protein n=1 Tax=Tulasnella calospora MUT 4182 TaxID=1051891 RepID=A0A0C3QG53_9AGAM|nr:hypothetical protein M407DRAFT_26196 [Tulasnella calospora MUT 4182]